MSLPDFHAGDSATIAACYRAHYDAIFSTVTRVLQGVDAETVIHEVFCRLLSSREMRESFRGGNLGAWLATVARNLAIDFARARDREVGEVGPEMHAHNPEEEIDEELEAKRLIEQFRREVLPSQYEAVFESRFIKQLPQREAAAGLSLPRSTLTYQEQRVRALLQRFLLGRRLP
jgi:RNA polymerase sigma-70 factor (ECF subfamily)